MARRTSRNTTQTEYGRRIYLTVYSPKFNWIEYLKLAEELAERSGDEAAQRAAVSRAYYAVYCYARNRLEQALILERDPKSSVSHQAIWKTYENDPRPGWGRIGQDGQNLKESRRRADYDDEQINDPERFAKKAIRQARSLNSSLQKLTF